MVHVFFPCFFRTVHFSIYTHLCRNVLFYIVWITIYKCFFFSSSFALFRVRNNKIKKKYNHMYIYTIVFFVQHFTLKLENYKFAKNKCTVGMCLRTCSCHKIWQNFYESTLGKAIYFDRLAVKPVLKDQNGNWNWPARHAEVHW